MGIAALIGMALSAVGVWLVFTTFRETAKANDLAREAIRPWLSVTVAGKSALTCKDEMYSCTLKVRADNVGSSPATAVRVFGIAAIMNGENAKIRHTLEQLARDKQPPTEGHLLVPGARHEQGLLLTFYPPFNEAWKEDLLWLSVLLVADYAYDGGRKLGRTIVQARITDLAAHGGMVVRRGGGDVPKERVGVLLDRGSAQ